MKRWSLIVVLDACSPLRDASLFTRTGGVQGAQHVTIAALSLPP